MRTKYPRYVGFFALLLASIQLSGDRSWQHRGRPLYLGPIRNRIDYANGTANSENWSGYAVLGSSFQGALGSWIVPASVCTGVQGYKFAAFWVGLDGYSSSTVEQIGTMSICDRTTPVYYAWYEFYPQPMYTVASIPLHPGDHVSAAVAYNTTSQQFNLAIKDATTGKSFFTKATVPGATRSSAEWIAEAPCCTSTGGILPLTDFRTITFGQDNTGTPGTNYAQDDSTTGPVGTFPPVNIIQISKVASSSSQATSACSALSTDGTSFSCNWSGAGNTPSN